MAEQRTDDLLASLREIPEFAALKEDTPPFDRRQMARLIRHSWRFLRPQIWHIVTILVVGALSGMVFLVATLLATDLVTNKILVGEKLQPLQTKVLFLDESYVRTEIEAGADPNEPDVVQNDLTTIETGNSAAAHKNPELSEAQRKIVRDRTVLLFFSLGLLVVALVAVLPYYEQWIWQSVNQGLRVRMHESLEHLSLKYHHNARVGDAIFRLYQDSAMVTQLLEGVLLPLIGLAWAMFYGVLFIGLFDPWLSALVLGCLIPILLLLAYASPRMRGLALTARQASSNLTSTLQETLGIAKVVKATSAETVVLDRFQASSAQALNAAFNLRLSMVILSAAVMTIGGMGIILAEYLMASWTVETAATFAGALFVAWLSYKVWNYGAFSSGRGNLEETIYGSFGFVRVWSQLQDLAVGLGRAFHLLELQSEVREKPVAAEFPEQVRVVEWSDVAFGYESTVPVLSQLNLTAKAGEITAIVGATGSGKTTLVTLLSRLFDPLEGHILVNGTDLRDFRIDDVRENVAVVLQKNALFSATVGENIAYAREDSSQEAIEDAAKIACAHDFIAELQDGYETELGERGAKLSSGQRQRLAIARALLRATPILVLDEPTASLDAETEHAVLRNIAEWARNRVVLLITHRISTIRSAQQVAFLKDQRIVELGTHDRLMSREEGEYRAFVEAEMVPLSPTA